jgi:hypothetical protein
MSTVTEIKAAIESLSPKERAELEALIWPEEETPPGVQEKINQALAGRFGPGDRRNIDRILSSLE